MSTDGVTTVAMKASIQRFGDAMAKVREAAYAYCRSIDGWMLEQYRCELSDLIISQCHHCQIGARTLGHLADLLGLGDDAPEE